MRASHLFSGIPVSDLPASLAWYERLLGRPPDRRPHAGEAVWQLTDSALLYVVSDPTRAGQALVTLIVDDLEGTMSEVRQRDIHPGPAQALEGGARKTTITDPDGNSIALAQVIS